MAVHRQALTTHCQRSSPRTAAASITAMRALTANYDGVCRFLERLLGSRYEAFMARTSPTAVVYLVLSMAGACSTWTYNIRWMLEVQRAMTAQEFLTVGFTGSALLGSLASDFWVGSLAALIYMIVEGRRLQMPRVWLYVALTFLVAWAFSFPLFLFMRERRLTRA